MERTMLRCIFSLREIINLIPRIRTNIGIAKQSQSQNQSSSRDNAISGGSAILGSTTGVSNQPTSDERITLIVDNTRYNRIYIIIAN